MKGRKEFTKWEADEIMHLIEEKVKASSDKQISIRNKIRRLGFYASDFGLSGGYTSNDFKNCVTITANSTSDSDQTGSSINKSRRIKRSRKDSDENYVLDICDEILNLQSSRQHRFSFLLGDAGTKLPVDSYYESKNLVVEYRELQHTEPVLHFDKPDVMTASGVSRGEQRKIYDQRRREVLPKFGIKLVEISYSDFEYDSKKRIVRNRINDTTIIKKLLS